MKNLKKIILAVMILGNVASTQAQVLTDADAKIVKQMQAGIVAIQSNIKSNFNLQKLEEVFRDSTQDLIVYSTRPTNIMHADEFRLVGSFSSKNLFYTTAYNDEHLIELLNIAANNMSKDVSSKWDIKETKMDNGETKKLILFEKNITANFETNTTKKTLVVYFGAEIK